MAITNKDLEDDLDKRLSQIRDKEVDSEFSSLAKQRGLTFSDLKRIPISTDALNIIDKETSRKANIAIISKRIRSLVLAVLDPEDPETQLVIKDLESKGFKVNSIITTPDGLESAWARYDLGKIKKRVELGAIEMTEEALTALKEKIGEISDAKEMVTGVPVTQALDVIVAGAIKFQASDIHFEPELKSTKLRYRIDGILKDLMVMDTPSYTKIMNRVKVISKLKINVHSAPQDGRFTIREGGTGIEVRVSILPSEYGETIVMRLLDPRTIKQGLEDLGIRKDLLEEIKKQLGKPNGAILTTGPTGSGKTTALYAFVNYLNNPESKILTIEDPIEYHVDGVSQTQVDPKKGYDFSNGLRSIVRQDPDIILVGEIRDADTAETAINASLTGHLVLSTLHTNDAAGTIPRLIEMKVKPELISPAINMALGQRLIRKLCNKCKRSSFPSEEDIVKIKSALDPITNRLSLKEVDSKTEIFEPVGCVECHNEGYKGRIGVFEGFTSNRDMEKLILKNPTISEVRDLAVSQGMITMLQDAYIKVIEGITTIKEIERIIQ